ncbi:hypothetical protein M3Y94_00658400 [Aphelenchoides besseyi]|nr:hypothetical protein M3Y94_00658400 [Aphelenchoides besseyi]
MSADTNVFACIDGYFYGLMEQRSEGKLIGIDLIRTNPLTNEQFQQPTSNWEVMDDITEGHLTVTYETFLVGKRVFKDVYLESENKTFIFSLDVDSLEWKKTVTLKGRISERMSNGTRTLIVRMFPHPEDSLVSELHRFVFEPEKLSTLVWLRLKRIFDAHPSAYEFICGKIPATFKLKHTPL